MSAMATAPARREFVRDRDGRVIGGVCAGLARTLGVDPLLLRIGFVAAATAGGTGIVLYALAWLAMPVAGETRSAAGRIADAAAGWKIGAGVACLVVAALLALRELGVWFSDALVWPTVLLLAGGALIWRQSQRREEAPVAIDDTGRRDTAAGPRATTLRLPRDAVGRAGIGAALVVLGGLAFLQFTDTLASARDVVLTVIVALVTMAIILAPWWLRLVRGLSSERAERIRTQERAEVAAHLHDSVLQTLALVQRQADDPRAVAQLARRQERELRAWLNNDARADAVNFSAALSAAAAEVEDAHRTPIEVVTVGDRELDAGAQAVVAAAREAMVNAAKFAAGAAISVYAEADPETGLHVFVRDRGPGFDPGAVPPERRGVRESIVGRMERHGGVARIHATPGGGTEVELEL